MKRTIKIKQIYAVEYNGEQYITCVTEDGKLLRYVENLKTKGFYWEEIRPPSI